MPGAGDKPRFVSRDWSLSSLYRLAPWLWVGLWLVVAVALLVWMVWGGAPSVGGFLVLSVMAVVLSAMALGVIYLVISVIFAMVIEGAAEMQGQFDVPWFAAAWLWIGGAFYRRLIGVAGLALLAGVFYGGMKLLMWADSEFADLLGIGFWRVLLAVLVIGATLWFVVGVWRGASSGTRAKGGSRGGRRLVFPADRSLGTLYTRPRATEWRGSDSFWPDQYEARGTVEIPRRVQVRLWASQSEPDGRHYRIPSELSSLRNLERNTLDSLMVRGMADIQVSEICRFRGLSELMLTDGSITDEGVVGFRKLQKLRSLDVLRTGLSDEGIAPLLEGIRELRYLFLRHLKGVGDGTLQALGALRDLQVLELPGSAISDEGMSSLAGLANLREVNLSDTAISDAGVRPLLGLESLVRLDLSDTQVSGSAFLEGSPRNLAQLDLYGSPVTDAAMEAIGRMDSLRVLGLIGTNVTNVGLAHVRNLKRLERLTLGSAEDSSPFNDQSLEHLRELTGLKHLTVSDDDTTPGGWLDLLEALPDLVSLHRLWDNYQTTEALEAFKEKLRRLPRTARPNKNPYQQSTPITDTRLAGSWSREGDVETGITSIAIDATGRPWVGGHFNSSSMDAELGPEWQHPDWKPPPSGPVFLAEVSALSYVDDAMWMGGRYGLWRHDHEGSNRVLHAVSSIFGSVAEGTDGTLWAIRRDRKLYRSAGAAWTEVELDLPQEAKLNDLAVDSDGTVWTCSTAGVGSLSGDNWTTWRGCAEGLPEWWSFDAWEPDEWTSVESIVASSDGVVWAGGYGGVFTLVDGVPSVVPAELGLPVVANDLGFGNDGRLYVVGGRRVAEYHQGRWRISEVPDDLLEDQFSLTAVGVAPDGLWIGTANGVLLRFRPDP